MSLLPQSKPCHSCDESKNLSLNKYRQLPSPPLRAGTVTGSIQTESQTKCWHPLLSFITGPYLIGQYWFRNCEIYYSGTFNGRQASIYHRKACNLLHSFYQHQKHRLHTVNVQYTKVKFCQSMPVYKLVGFWPRYAPVRCAYPSFEAHQSANRRSALRCFAVPVFRENPLKSQFGRNSAEVLQLLL
jgi:hypothetical protein